MVPIGFHNAIASILINQPRHVKDMVPPLRVALPDQIAASKHSGTAQRLDRLSAATAEAVPNVGQT